MQNAYSWQWLEPGSVIIDELTRFRSQWQSAWRYANADEILQGFIGAWVEPCKSSISRSDFPKILSLLAAGWHSRIDSWTRFEI